MDNLAPYFSILIPCFRRPEYAKEALESVLLQTGDDYEVIVSNNGADLAVRESIAQLTADRRVDYVEPSSLLSMPDHWEYLKARVRGKYVLVLTDRSVLKKNALRLIKSVHDAIPWKSEVVSWAWDLYYNDEKILIRHGGDGCSVVINSHDYLLRAARYLDDSYPYALPRGLNSCISSKVLNQISDHCGSSFGRLNPDFSLGYRCLHTVDEFVHIDGALMISQGLRLSNGGNSTVGDGSAYIKTLGLTMAEAFDKVPIKLPFVAAGIPQDLLKAFDQYNNVNCAQMFNRAQFFVNCFIELDLKKSNRSMSKATVNDFEMEIFSVLSRESVQVRAEVQASLRALRTLRYRLKLFFKGLFSKYAPTCCRILLMRMRGGVKIASALEA
jgi:glycosyltransferase involved in cell wall biosynthesis